VLSEGYYLVKKRIELEIKREFRDLFEESFNTLYGTLHRYAFTFLKSNDQASDVVQNTFVKWWETQTFTGGIEDARKYLFTAVYRSCLNVIRNEKVKLTSLTNYSGQQSNISQFVDHTEYEELSSKIHLAIEALPTQCKVIFRKSRFEEKRYLEIAQEMNLSIKTVEVQMGKALRMLRANVLEDGSKNNSNQSIGLYHE
jgi:RNA polymerase sigma-70 factor, ECF subfamily